MSHSVTIRHFRPGDRETQDYRYERVRRGNPCPLCQKTDWCLVSTDRQWAICPRTPNKRSLGEPGYLHQLGGVTKPVPRDLTRWEAKKPTIDFTAYFDELWANESTATLDAHAQALGLSADALIEYGGVWAPSRKAIVWPMYDADMQIVGGRTRHPDGAKLSLHGGRNGVFLPRELLIEPDARRELVVVCEGPTDAGALYDMGLFAVARHSCTGAREIVRAIVSRIRPKQVILIADRDKPEAAVYSVPGANKLAALLASMTDVRLIRPQRVKDVRDWKATGATRDTVLSCARNTSPFRAEEAA